MGAEIPRFDRKFFDGTERFTRIGEGAIGGKASGLLRGQEVLAGHFDAARFPDFTVEIPTLTVLATDVFERFVEDNGLLEVALTDAPDDRIAAAFQHAPIPVEIVGDLRALIAHVKTPIAVRSSSLLEDRLYRPFAGVYGTKMIPNNQPDPDGRFKRLVEAIKYVWASAFFAAAKSYVRMTEHSIRDERMAVILQEVVGRRSADRFYPDVSGVARSYNFYRSGAALPEEGVVNLAIGLGKAIVDGGVVWSYSPAHPRVGPPFASPSALLRQTQTELWAVNMGKPPAYDPIRETEYLVRLTLREAEEDGVLRFAGSTFDPQGDRLYPGVGRPGPRAVTFAPLLTLEDLPFNDLLRALLRACESGLGEKVEVEFALLLPPETDAPARLGFLQVRPLAVAADRVEIAPGEMEAEGVLLASQNVLGNGTVEDIRDVVYVKPEGFEPRLTRGIAAEIAALNLAFLEEDRPFLLLGFGRWGSSDPSLGIPVQWGQICAAKALVEATLPAMNVEPSQGSHFFHNIQSFGVSYFCVRHDRDDRLDWERLARQEIVAETEHVRHVRFPAPLLVKVDGTTGRGLVRVHD